MRVKRSLRSGNPGYSHRMASRDELTRLTGRWRTRRDARRRSVDDRPASDVEREALALNAFPFRSVTPAAYVAERGQDMIGFTYDEERYTDADLDAWLLEVGRLLRAAR